MYHCHTSTKWFSFVHKRKQFILIKSPTNDNRQPTTIKLNRTELSWTDTAEIENDEKMQKWKRIIILNGWYVVALKRIQYSVALSVKFHVPRNQNIPYNNHPFNRSFIWRSLELFCFFYFYLNEIHLSHSFVGCDWFE